MEKAPPKPTEVDRKRKESRIAYTLLAILVVAGGIGYGIYYWTDSRANRQALLKLSEEIAIDSSGQAADKQSREVIQARGWKHEDDYVGNTEDQVFHRKIKMSENPGPNDWVLHLVFEGRSTKGVFVRTQGSKTTRPAGAPEDRIADKEKAWVKQFGG
jgi:uncharacterized protein HemX